MNAATNQPPVLPNRLGQLSWAGQLQKAMDFIVPALASGALKPVIDRVFESEQIQAAHAYMEAGRQFGKIVVNVRSKS